MIKWKNQSSQKAGLKLKCKLEMCPSDQIYPSGRNTFKMITAVVFLCFLSDSLSTCLLSVPLRPGSLRHRPQTPQHSLHRPLFIGVYPQDHGVWFCRE